MSRHTQGFTLIELLLVLVILAVLAAVVVPKFTGRREQANQAAAKAQISNLQVALDGFEIDVGRYPTSEEGLQGLMDEPTAVKNWKGPYLPKAVGNDPWGNPYQYVSPGTHSKAGYDLFSYGPDGHEGGGDDLDNWTTGN